MNATSVSNPGRAAHPLGVGAAIAAAILVAAAPAPARPNIRSAFFTVYPSAVGSKLDNLPSFTGHCAVCHYDASGGGLKNPYGEALANSGKNLNKEQGRIQAVEAVANLDSDADGYTTLTEITAAGYSNTPTFPGLSSANVGQVTGVPTLELSPHVTPTTVVDNTPPDVTVIAPEGGESLTANTAFNVTWSAVDALEDPDHDGLGNLAECAFGSAPRDAGSAHRPQAAVAEEAGVSHFALRYVRSTGNPTAEITAEVSGDLVTWQSGPGFTTIHQATDNGDGTETVVERMLAPISESAHHFMRLRVTPR